MTSMDPEDDIDNNKPSGWLHHPPKDARSAATGWLHRSPEAEPTAEMTAAEGELHFAAPEPTTEPQAETVPVERAYEAPKPRRFRLPRPGRKTAIVVGVVGALLAGGASYAAYDYGQNYDGRIMPGSTIAGVDVGGMSRNDAITAIEEAIEPELTRSITLSWQERQWQTTPAELGARSNARRIVDEALQMSSEASFFKRMKMAVLGEDLGFVQDVAIRYPRSTAHAFIEGIASGFDRDVRNAAIDYSSGWVEIVPERNGREVNVEKSQRALLRALRGGDDNLRLAVNVTAPEVTSDGFDQVLLLRIGENKLYLYQDGEITHSWVVATGQPEYPTPTGIYEVTEKRYMPTWVNPDPEGWGADMPAMIPPGPGNPLGVRALNWSAAAIRFHGTSATYSLGYNASHGCVRLSNTEVITLYDLVDVGTPIVSTVVAPLKPLYVSAPDPIVVQDEGESEGNGGGRKSDA